MIKQLQMGIKLLRYAYGKKINTILGLIMFLIGMVMELFAGGNSGFSMGSYFNYCPLAASNADILKCSGSGSSYTMEKENPDICICGF